MEQFNEYFQLAYDDEEIRSIYQNKRFFKEVERQYLNYPEASQNSALTGLDEQIPHDNQGTPSNKENDEEKVDQSKKQAASISKNNNSHKGKKTRVNPSEETTNYKTEGTDSSSAEPRREHKINSAGAACLHEIHRLLNNDCKKYGFELEAPNFQHLFCGNILYHKQFIKAKIYQILRHESAHNDQVIHAMVKEKNDMDFIYKINLTFEFMYKKYIEEKKDNNLSIDENEEIGIRTLKEVVEERIKKLEKKGTLTKEKIQKIKDFELNSKNFFKELNKINTRSNCKEPKFHFEVVSYIENYPESDDDN